VTILRRNRVCCRPHAKVTLGAIRQPAPVRRFFTCRVLAKLVLSVEYASITPSSLTTWGGAMNGYLASS
jgi:hypothetical protein